MRILLIFLLVLSSCWAGGCGDAAPPATLYSVGHPDICNYSPPLQQTIYLVDLADKNPPSSLETSGNSFYSRCN